MHRLLPAEVLEHLGEERIRAAVVERDVGRRADDDERSRGIELEALEHGAVRLEVGQVVLLLQPRVLQELRRLRAVLGQALRRNRVRHDDLRRRAAAELVLKPGELVVERRRARDAEPPRGHRQLVRAVGERDVEVASLRPVAKRPQARCHRARLAEPRAAAVLPDHLRLDPVQLQQLQRLGVVARGELDLRSSLAQQRHQRPEHQHVGRCRHVDPDLHRSASSSGTRASPGVRSTWRSCQSVNASRPQSWRLRSSLPATWSSSRRVTASGRKNPCRRRVSGASVSRANGSSSPRSQAAAGIEKPSLLPAHDLGGQEWRDGPSQQDFLAQAAHPVPGRQRQREVRHHRVEERHARLERVGHRRAVGLHEQVVDEVDAEVDVLQAREQLGTLGLGEAGAVEVDRVEAVAPAGQLGARVGREDLLPGVMALERRQVRPADEALRLVVEARPGARARQALDQRASEPG